MTPAFHTETEIAGQPEIWRRWAEDLPAIADDVRRWIADRAPDEIWLTGAGTSAFIADSLAVALDRRRARLSVRNVPSTSLVARPQDYFRDGVRPLVVSFGRSGDSSESVGTLDLLDRRAPTADRLNITCNASSVLASRRTGDGETRVVTLPPACHDRGFAMTSSYTTMLLTALTCLSDVPLDGLADRLGRLAGAASRLLALPLDVDRPARAVFLGSGPFLGTARESALKVLELSAGRVVGLWDSTLGFRHGPKAVVDDDTRVFVFLSSDPLSRRYDDDIAAEIRAQYPRVAVTTLGEAAAGAGVPDIPLGTGLDDVWNTPVAVLLAQRLAVVWSKSLGLNVDDPFAGHNLTRVVSHVRLYE